MANDEAPTQARPLPITDRRRRPRLVGETTGWLLPATLTLGADGRNLPDDEAGWEVRVHDVSRLGVGFGTTERLDPGDRVRIRIGRGPAARARAVMVVCCRLADDGTFHCGAEFTHVAAGDRPSTGRPARRLAKAG